MHFRADCWSWLIHQHGYRWNDDGNWTRQASQPRPEAVLHRGDLLLVDEAGMLDQDSARALLTIADEQGARIALVGDRHQLPAVGRGGVLDLAARWADPDACLTLDTVHRFADPAYADLSLAMRTGTGPGAVFDQLVARGQVVLHPDDTVRVASLADEAATTGAFVVTDTREQVADLNAAIRDRRIAAGTVDDTRTLTTRAGERVGVGDRVATRRNDHNLGVANRDTWTVRGIDTDGTLQLAGNHSTQMVPADYAVEHVELAYASTIYGAQGETTDAAHLVVGEHTGAAAAYVAMTRGRDLNTAHLVAENVDDARSLWIQVFNRDRADLGPAHAAKLAAEESAKYDNGHPADPGRNQGHRRLEGHEARRRREQLESRRPTTPDRGPGIGF